MNFPNRKSILSLLLAVALVAGTLSGCQPTPETTSTTTPTDPPNRYIDDYPPDWIPPEWIEAWEQGWAAFPNDTYYTAGLQWAIDSIQLSDAWDISTGSGTIRVGVIDSGVDASHPDLQNRSK